MQLHTHIISGWCFANTTTLTPRERLLCMVAAVLPDIDGIGILIDVKYYHKYHHILGHTIFFGILSSLLLMLFSQHRVKAFVMYFILFHVHILLDFLGSGPGWGMKYLWPVSDFNLENPYVWELQSWQCTVVFFLLLVWVLRIIYIHKRSPLEKLWPKMDKKLCSWFINFVNK